MKRVFVFLEMIFAVFLEKEINLLVRFRFLGIYFFDLLKNKLKNQEEKKVHFLNNRNFFYLGQHLNLLLDHFSLHLKIYRKYYQQATTVLDVGASFGTFALSVNYFNPKAKIYAFEPAKQPFKLLEKNCQGIWNIKLFNCAIGQTRGGVSFKYNQSSPEESGVIKMSESQDEYLVPIISLDDFLFKEKIDTISLLKIDVEGYESEVLLGAKRALCLSENIIIEVNMTKIKNVINILQIMGKDGFAFTEIGSINYKKDRVDSMDLIFTKLGETDK